MRLIGLTGGIGVGKSVVGRILRLRGFNVYDCDLRAKELMEESGSIRSGLRGRFGEECFLDNGRLNRGHIARIVFNDDKELEFLNGLVHGEVREDILMVSGKWAAAGAEIAFVESAIMHTSGLDSMCDEIWVVTAPEEVRLDRAVARDNASRESVMSRMAAQKKELSALQPEKIRRIDNSGSTSLLRAIDSLLELSPESLV